MEMSLPWRTYISKLAPKSQGYITQVFEGAVLRAYVSVQGFSGDAASGYELCWGIGMLAGIS